MAKTKVQKQEVIDKVESAMKNASSSVFVHFRGINVGQETAMRRGFRAENLGYTVAKKTLIRRALDTLGHDHANMQLEGELAVAYSKGEDSDPTAAARRVHAYAGEFGAEKIVIMGGIFQGNLVDAEAMREIATIPSMNVLRSKLLNLIQSPLQRITVVLDQHAQKEA